MMLYSYLKGFEENIFSEDFECPFTKDMIEQYFQILLPVYIFTNDIQSISSDISMIIPSILTLIHENLEKMCLTDENQIDFRNSLVSYLKSKFEYELSSQIYLVSSVLNVGLLSNYKEISVAEKYINLGLNSLTDVLCRYANTIINSL